MIGTQTIQLPLKLCELKNSLLTCNINSKYKSKNLENPTDPLYKEIQAHPGFDDKRSNLLIYRIQNITSQSLVGFHKLILNGNPMTIINFSHDNE